MKRMFAVLAVLALVLAACGGDSGGDGSSGTEGSGSTGDAAAGQEIYDSTCVACHGADATGIDGLGADLTNSAFIADHSDAEMVDFLEVGRPADASDNVTGVQMPPKGGNPALTDDDLYDVVAYLNTLPGN